MVPTLAIIYLICSLFIPIVHYFGFEQSTFMSTDIQRGNCDNTYRTMWLKLKYTSSITILLPILAEWGTIKLTRINLNNYQNHVMDLSSTHELVKKTNKLQQKTPCKKFCMDKYTFQWKGTWVSLDMMDTCFQHIKCLSGASVFGKEGSLQAYNQPPMVIPLMNWLQYISAWNI